MPRLLQERLQRLLVVALLVVAMIGASIQLVAPSADAIGPAYDGPQTVLGGPAYFGPAPNPFPYCENPTYFDPFPENVNPIGRIDPTGAPNASVTTDNITMDFQITAEGSPGTQYPGFFPADSGFGVEGADFDQPKGVEMAFGDAAIVTLSEPLFFTQWVFTDIDRANEGFDVVPLWTDPTATHAAAVFGGDAAFEFIGTTENLVQFNDTDQTPQDAWAQEARVQVDFIGAVNGITMARDPGLGQSGFAIGGGCSPIGVAKQVTEGPTWNGTSYEITYTLKVRNNLPSGATIAAHIDDVLTTAPSGTLAGTVVGIDMTAVQLEDVLTDPAFGAIEIVSLTNTSGQVQVNADYDGDGNTNLIATGEIIPADTEEEFVLVVSYLPADDGPLGPACASTFSLQNSAVASGLADGIPVIDTSDDGADPDPGVDNGAGGVDDATTVVFPCPPAGLEIVKTVVEQGTPCPVFADGVPGDGDPLEVISGDTVTYCISVQNPGISDMVGVTVTDPHAPPGFQGGVGTLSGGTFQTVQFDLVVDEQTPPLNTATATGTSPVGPLEVSDTALINVSPPIPGDIELTKTVVRSTGSCAAAVEGVDELVVDAPAAPVLWCFSITNTSDTPLASISFDDALLGIADRDVLAAHGGGAPSLAPGASVSFEEVGQIPTAGALNTASVTAVPSDAAGVPTGAAPVGDSNTAAVDSTDVLLAKQVVAGPSGDCATAVESVLVPVGTTVTYCFTVTNTGSTDLQVTEVVDGDLGITVDIPAGQQILATGGSVTVTAEVPATAMVNTATVTGTPVDDAGTPIPDAPNPTDDDDAAVLTQAPGLTIVKTVVAGPGGTCPADLAAGIPGDGPALPTAIGEMVTYCLNVANTGEVDIENVVVSDPLAPAGFVGQLGTLTVGAETVTSFDLMITASTPTLNTATVTGDDPAGGQLPPDDDTALITLDPTPRVALSKTVVDADGECAAAVEGVDERVIGVAGDAITWCFEVTNTGNVPLAAFQFDDLASGVSGLDVLAEHGTGSSLGANESIRFAIASTIPSGGLDNVATVVARAADPDGTVIDDFDPVEDQNDASVDEIVADLAVTKEVSDPGPLFVGRIVTYTIVVTNNGPDPAVDPTLTDVVPAGVSLEGVPTADGWACARNDDGYDCARASAMPAGVSETLTYTAALTRDVPIGTLLTNTVEVASTTFDPDLTNNRDSSTTRTRAAITDIPLVEDDPPPPPDEPDEVLGDPPLAVTGAASKLLTSLATVTLAFGGVLVVVDRRRRFLLSDSSY